VDTGCSYADVHMLASVSGRHRWTRSTDIEACMNLAGRGARDVGVDEREAGGRKAFAIEAAQA
jgi:hypothetical protein